MASGNPAPSRNSSTPSTPRPGAPNNSQPPLKPMTKSVPALVAQLKDNGEDHEWYPTTNEIITGLCVHIGLMEVDAHGRRERGTTYTSVLDIGAGNGKVLTAIKERCGFSDLFAIEKAH